MNITDIAWSAAGLGFIFLMTTLGAATVFLFRKADMGKYQNIFLGFAAGVMIAASIWSLLIPSIEATETEGGIGWIPAAVGFTLGALFLLGLDKVIPHLHSSTGVREGRPSASKRTMLMFSAVTLHNIPEGMAVGLAFALASQTPGAGGNLLSGGGAGAYTAAIALAIGIGIQNFPEGAAVTLPFRQEGYTAWKSFLLGALTGAVEPVFGILAALLAGLFTEVMPWLLAFAAGAMIYVVVEEMIPEAHLGEHSNKATLSVMAGFLVMMILDLALG
ncbi:MAG: ZIP family metal transporter [Oscillospiraceae bacterium]|jgi:ZIP family zinc transporter|nr:ZIP family metal transporter [Oscillospiraceae bacterium]